MYLSPTTQELLQSQAWPLLHLSIFTMDFWSNASALLTNHLYHFITNILVPLLIWAWAHQLTLFPSPDHLIEENRALSFSSCPFPSAQSHLTLLGHSHTLRGGLGGLHKYVLPPGTLTLNIFGVWSAARKALVGLGPAQDRLLPSSSSPSALCLVSQHTPATKWDA